MKSFSNLNVWRGEEKGRERGVTKKGEKFFPIIFSFEIHKTLKGRGEGGGVCIGLVLFKRKRNRESFLWEKKIIIIILK